MSRSRRECHRATGQRDNALENAGYILQEPSDAQTEYAAKWQRFKRASERTIKANEYRIEAFKEKQSELREAFINTGTYCFERGIFSLLNTPSKFSIEHDFFPHLVGQGFYAFKVDNRFIDIGTPERYSWAQEHLKSL